MATHSSAASLPDYIQAAQPNPPSNRAPWYKNTAPTYAGIFLWFVFWDQMASNGLNTGGLWMALLGVLIGGLICHFLFYLVGYEICHHRQDKQYKPHPSIWPLHQRAHETTKTFQH